MSESLIFKMNPELVDELTSVSVSVDYLRLAVVSNSVSLSG